MPDDERPDAEGPDATGLDATGLDATGPDAPSPDAPSLGLSRRGFLAAAAAAGALAWIPVFRVPPASAQGSCAPPPGFPGSIPVYRQAWRNWSGELVVDELWTCAPQTPADVVTVVNWARDNGWRVRARGSAHGWSPLTVTAGADCATPVLLVDTTQHLTSITVHPARRVTVQTGATMEALLTRLEESGLGLAAAPAPGVLTVGGVLAIDGHGTAVPALGETRAPGHTYGSLSNLVTSLTAVVWDAAFGRYVLRTFDRADPQIGPLLTHLGRTLVTEVTLQVGVNQRLRCQSFVDVPATELFAAPGTAGRTLSGYLDGSGRAEAIWFPFTAKPWLKVWSVSPVKPLLSRPVNSPYNYPFSDSIPEPVSALASAIVAGDGWLTPIFGQAQYDAAAAGLLATLSSDLWGWSKNTLLYIRPTTLRVTTDGYAILTRRADVQRVVHEFTTYYTQRVAAYQAQGRYPINGPVEIRVTGLDQPADVEASAAAAPTISALRPRPDHPEWDVAVWFNLLTIPGTPYSNQFYREVEQWVFANYPAVRPEWSKGWAYTDGAGWSDPVMLGTTIPAAFRAGLPPDDDWDTALAVYDALDPHGVFRNTLLDQLMS